MIVTVPSYSSLHFRYKLEIRTSIVVNASLRIGSDVLSNSAWATRGRFYARITTGSTNVRLHRITLGALVRLSLEGVFRVSAHSASYKTTAAFR